MFENPGAVHNSAREYRMCAGFAAAAGNTKVQVQYNNYAADGGPQLVVFKQHYQFPARCAPSLVSVVRTVTRVGDGPP